MFLVSLVKETFHVYDLISPYLSQYYEQFVAQTPHLCAGQEHMALQT